MKIYLLIGSGKPKRQKKGGAVPHKGDIITTKNDRDYEVTAVRHDYGRNKVIVACIPI